MSIYEQIVKDAKLGTAAWCRTCGQSKEVDPALCLAHGWPKHCGHTMTIDDPNGPFGWRPTNGEEDDD